MNGDSPLLLLGATGDTCNTTNNDTNMPTNPPPLPLTSEHSNPITSFLKQRDLKISKILAGHKHSIIPKSTQLPGQCKCVCTCGNAVGGEGQPAEHRTDWCSRRARWGAPRLAVVNEQRAGAAAQFCKAQGREEMIHALPDLSLPAHHLNYWSLWTCLAMT